MPSPAPEGVVALGHIIKEYNLKVTQHVPIHGQPGSHEQFLKIFSCHVLILSPSVPAHASNQNGDTRRRARLRMSNTCASCGCLYSGGKWICRSTHV